MAAPRVVIDDVSPCVDHGAYPAKGIVGQRVVVEADIFLDGHERPAARLIWRGTDSAAEHSVPMRSLGRPLDIVGATILLASDASAYINGTIIRIDGGPRSGTAFG